ncbi:uncharacterized protein LOC118460740 isoform X2 [Anopheles albimanus]|uniref:uncharacterized protein LOC118460740 isoform X2 n=1 Tax=Anopheles albimanus TaxID=7167 RepID=UPI00163F28D6|nr:uncharacterized protein LOC118460740 isoform X2 [Anopheles albimanus]
MDATKSEGQVSSSKTLGTTKQVGVTKPVVQKKKSTQIRNATERDKKTKPQNENKPEPLANANTAEVFDPDLDIQSAKGSGAISGVAIHKQKNEQEKPSSQQKNKPSSCHGSNYQVKITMWTLLYAQRDLSEGKYSKCSITAEDPNGGKFDDTVIVYTEPTGLEKSIYIQTKHRDLKDKQNMDITFLLKKDDFLGKKANPFSLAKYYKSFCELGPKRSIAKFMLCTNQCVSNDVRYLKKVELTDGVFANFKRFGASIYKLNKEELVKDHNVDKDLKEGKELDAFISQFFLIINVVDEAIDKDIQDLWRFIIASKASILSLPMGLMEQSALNGLFVEAWRMTVTRNKRNEIDVDKMFQDILRKFYFQHLKGASSNYCNSLFELNDDHLTKTKLYKICVEGGIHNYHTSVLSTEVCCNIIHQIARLLESEYIFTDYKKYLETAYVLQDIFCFIECDLVLVVVCENNSSLTIFQELIKNNATGFRRSVIMLVGVNKQNESEEFSVSHLTNDSKKEIYMNYPQIKLWHTNIPLENFITQDDDLALLYGLITTADEEKHKTHPCVKNIEKIQTLYINRIWKPIDRENYLSPQRLYYRAKYMPLSLAQLIGLIVIAHDEDGMKRDDGILIQVKIVYIFSLNRLHVFTIYA